MVRNFLKLILSLDNYRLHKKRLKELQLNIGKNKDVEIDELIDKLTKPIILSILPKLKIKNIEEVGKDLKTAKWDKKMTAQQFIALKLITKVLGVIAFLIFSKVSMFMAAVWGVPLFFGLGFFLNNSVNNRKEKIMIGLPDFIRITQGHLTANMTFSNAISETIRFMGDEWQEILQRLVVEVELNGMDSALESLKEEIDLFEIREFVSIVKLVMEQGGNAKDAFNSQAERVQDMLYSLMELKINKRKTIGILVHGPLLLCNMVAFGLPTVGQFMNFSGM